LKYYKTFFEKRTYLNTQKVKPLKNSGFTFQFVELEGVHYIVFIYLKIKILRK